MDRNELIKQAARELIEAESIEDILEKKEKLSRALDPIVIYATPNKDKTFGAHKYKTCCEGYKHGIRFIEDTSNL